MLIERLGHCWSKIEQSRSTGDANRHGTVYGLRHAEGIEACRTLVGHRVTFYFWYLVEVVDNGCIAASRTHHGMSHAIGLQQSCQDVYVFFVAIHGWRINSFGFQQATHRVEFGLCLFPLYILPAAFQKTASGIEAQ